MMRGLLAILVLSLAAGTAMAQTAPAPKAATKSKPALVASRPAWAELTGDQQKVLAPLKADWDALDRDRKLKWVGIAKRYPAMKPAEQQRVQKRMQAWAKLTPQQRRQARENFRQIAKHTPEERHKLAERWAEYQREQSAVVSGDAPEQGEAQQSADQPAESTIPASSNH